MINPFKCINPNNPVDASDFFHLEHPYPPLCSPTVLAFQYAVKVALHLAASSIHLAFHLALIVISLYVLSMVVLPILNWRKRYRQEMELREEQEDDEGDDEGAGDLPYKLWNTLKYLGSYLEVSVVAAVEYISAAHESIASAAWGPLPVLSDHDEQDSRSASPTPVPDLSEELQELNLKRDILDEQRKDFLQIYGYLGSRAFRGPQFEAYLKKRGVLNKAFRFIREALTPPGDPLPGSLRRENAVTRTAFLNGDTRPRKECFDSDEETVV